MESGKTQAGEYAVRMVDITKTFGSTVANKNVSLDIMKGEILSP